MATAKDRARWHRDLKKFWERHPIETCEVRLPGCWGTFGLAPAHGRKRRKIETKAQYFCVVAACQKCHREMDERMSHEAMEALVMEVIGKRPIELQPHRYFSDSVEEGRCACGDDLEPGETRCKVCLTVMS